MPEPTVFDSPVSPADFAARVGTGVGVLAFESAEANLAELVRAGVCSKTVLATGTMVHTIRLRKAVAERLRIDSRDVTAFCAGCADGRVLPLWSSAVVAGVPLHQWAVPGHGRMTVRERTELFMSIIAPPTADEIAEAGKIIVEAVMGDWPRVLAVSAVVESFEGVGPAVVSLPRVVSAGGVGPVVPVSMNDAERLGLIEIIKNLSTESGHARSK